jgi:hypothetical protein
VGSGLLNAPLGAARVAVAGSTDAPDPSAAAGAGGPDAGERSRRSHLLLDAYGFEGDREVSGSVVPQRARRQAGVIRRAAAAGDPACIALLPIAGLLESSAVDVEALPRDFWLR